MYKVGFLIFLPSIFMKSRGKTGKGKISHFCPNFLAELIQALMFKSNGAVYDLQGTVSCCSLTASFAPLIWHCFRPRSLSWNIHPFFGRYNLIAWIITRVPFPKPMIHQRHEKSVARKDHEKYESIRKYTHKSVKSV